MAFNFTVKQDAIVKELSSTVISSGKKALYLRMEVNEKGGAHLDMAVKDENGYARTVTIYLCLDSEYVMRQQFATIGKRINLKSKTNATMVESIITKLLDFYD